MTFRFTDEACLHRQWHNVLKVTAHGRGLSFAKEMMIYVCIGSIGTTNTHVVRNRMINYLNSEV